MALTDAQRGQLVTIWMLAADRDGKIPNDPSLVQRLCQMETAPDLELFVKEGFLLCPHPGANVTPDRRQIDANTTPQIRGEERREEERRAAPQDGVAAAPPPSAPSGLLAYYENQYISRIRKPVFFDGTETPKAQALVRTYGLQEMQRAVDRYFSEGDDYTREHGFPFYLFVKQVTKYIAGKSARGSPEDDAAILKRVEEELAREKSVN